MGRLDGLAESLATFALAVALTFAATGYFSTSTKGQTVNLFIWSAYLAPRTLHDFTERTGIDVRYDLYDSNEALLAKIEAGNADYDVIVPSDYMVEIMVHRGLLRKLDGAKVPNRENIDPDFRGLPFDPRGEYGVPYFWGTTGIGYRTDKVPGSVDSWEILWDARYKDRITMLDDERENIGAALKSTGASLNSTDEALLAKAKQRLMDQKPLLKEYNSSNFQEMLISGDAWLTHAYNGQIAKAAREYPMIGYAIPREGCTRSVDYLCIPVSARHVEEAHKLVNFLLDARVAANLCAYCFYSTPNKAARALLPEELRNNPIIFPPADRLARCEYIRDVGTAINRYDKIWTEVKSQ